MDTQLERLGLRFNPFEPAASGAPLGLELWIPARWGTQIQKLLDTLEGGQGVKALAIQGEYGSGKTYLLRWLELVELPLHRRIRPYFFDNPGVQFYDLANRLLRQVGRYEFAKMLWEYLSPELPGFQMTLFEQGLIPWLRSVKKFKRQDDALSVMAKAIKERDIASDEEIAYKLAQIVVGTLDQPYFEYRDFVAGRRGAVVAEKEEAPYFTAIIRILKEAGHSTAIAFLVDEFEEISLQKRLTRKQAYDYLATMKRLINVARDEDFWLIVSMTPEAAGKIQQLEASLWDRFTSQGAYEFQIPPLNEHEATELLRWRLREARLPSEEPPTPDFPFPEELASILHPTTVSLPRRLVKVAFYAIAEAQQKLNVTVPFTLEFVRQIEERVYPTPEAEGEETSL
jgi:type II secretory pathway predicted ATPase ExeA